nr:putative reverse transcriptase domain-containing protein [Tanacetum cinerariifolium]
MSSPNDPTSKIEDAFSLNFLDFIPASPDYVPASPGKTYSSSSNSFGVVLIASPSLSLFHDDPYMKVMHAYYAEKSPILPLIIIHPSLMPNPQEFFLSEELLSPKKQGHDQSSSSTSTMPQIFKIGESSRKTSLERHKEKIEGIQNHLDKLSLDHIEHIENKIEGLGQGRVVIQQDFNALEAELQQARAQITKLHRKQMGSNQKISLACFRIIELEHIINDIQILFSYSNCTEDCKVKFATGTLTEEALSWWNSFAQPIGIEESYKITWVEFKADKSFISLSFTSMLKISPITIDNFYDIEMADENLVSTNTVIQGYTLTLLNQSFKIDLMSIKLDSFDIVIGMEWLSKNHAKILCDEKVIHIPIDGETLIIRVMEKKSDEKRIEDIPVVKEFPDIFLDDLPCLPPVRQVEFQIDLISGIASVAHAPYRLAHSKMQELSNQL